MDGLFDDLIPQSRRGPEQAAAGMFDDLIPGGNAAAPLQADRVFQSDEHEKIYQTKLAAERERRSKTIVPFSGFELPSPEVMAAQETQRTVAKAEEQAEFDASRTPLNRLADAATFAASIPVRTFTQGQHGIGDLVGLVNKNAGSALRQNEQDFARANATALGVMKDAGDVMIGVPGLQTMGAPFRATSTIGRHIANRPLPQRAARRGARQDTRLQDVEAFNNSNVEPFGPALTDAGLAGTVKQLSEAPVVGAPVRQALERTVNQTAAAGERVARQFGDGRSFRDGGDIAETGLNRFKNDRVQRVGQRGTDDPTPDSVLDEIISRPARNTTLKTKGDALYERAWRNIPENMVNGRAVRSEGRYVGNMSNTMELLREIQQRNARMVTGGGTPRTPDAATMPIQGGGMAARMAADIQSGAWRGNLQSMRDVRSEFRRLASGITDTEKNSLKGSDMRRLQSAMTRDMIGLLERNMEGADGVAIRRAIHDFRRADQFTRASAKRLETVEKLYKANSSEALGLSIFKDAMGGKKGGNFKRLTALRRSLREEEWGDIVSGVIREMSVPVGSARGHTQAAGFSVSSFITNWQNMSREGRAVLFRNPANRELGRALDDFVRVADRVANFEALANSSRSATNALGVGGLVSALTAAQQAMTGNLKTAAAAGSVAAGTYAFARFMSSPTYVRWLTRGARLNQQSGGRAGMRAHAQRLMRLAELEPDADVQQFMAALAQQIGEER